MKKNKIFKALTFIAIAVMLLAMFALPICAEDTTSSPQIQINPDFDDLRAELERMEAHMWGVSLGRGRRGSDRLDHVEFTVRVEDGEEHIVRRLERERRVGVVERLDEHTYLFSADVCDSGELIPWMRTFICRIVHVRFSNRVQEQRFKEDLNALYRLYGIDGEVST